jgi:RNA polymerase sigma-70 factor (ECF subfamily)
MAQGEAKSEAELIAAVIAREGGAWPELYRRFERVIIGCVRNTLRRYSAFATDEDIEDIVNTTCLNLVKDDFKKLRTFDASRGYRLSSWMGLIATNTALDALRRRDPGHTSLDSLDDDGVPLQVADPSAPPEGQMERREQWRALLEAIQELPEADRRFLELYYDEELAPEQLAARLGITVNTVYSRKNKLREKLKKLLGPP